MLYRRLTSWMLLLAIGHIAGCTQRPTASKNQPSQSSPEIAVEEAPNVGTEPNADVTEFDPSQLIAQSATITQLLLAGDASAAHQKFSVPYRDQVSLDALRKLSNELRELFGNSVSKIEFLETQFGETDVKTRTETLRVSHFVDFEGGKQAISTVNFFLPADEANSEGGELASIDVRETWPSFSPNTLQTAKESLQVLFTDELMPQGGITGKSSQSDTRTNFMALLHPDLRPLIQGKQLDDCIEQIASYFGPIVEHPQWSQWSYQTEGQHLSALGIVTTKQDKVEIRADFSNEKLIGLTCIGLNSALSTLDWLEEQTQAAAVGKLFWESVFRGELAEAHSLLAPKFQQELPLNEFESAISESGLADSAELKVVELDTIRFSNRLERSDAVRLAAFFLATFNDGSQQSLQCEFGIEDNSQLLLSFTNDFEAVIPVAEPDRVQTVVNAFLSNEPEQVERLLDAAGKKCFDEGICKVFLQQLRGLLVSGRPSIENVRVLHVYHPSNRTEQLRARIVTPQRSIPFLATTQGDALTSFNFSAPELLTFASSMVDIGGVEEFGQEFVRQWMKASETEQAIVKMVGIDDRLALLAKLESQRDSLLTKHGHFLWSDLISWKISDSRNEIQAIYELEFADQTLQMQLTFEVNAIGAKVSSASILAEAK